MSCGTIKLMNAWIFDVDGVLTNLKTKNVAEPKILTHMYNILAAGDIVALNTGRSLATVEDHVLKPFFKVVLDKSHLRNLFVVCEMGNVTATVKNAEITKRILDDPILSDFSDKIQEIIKEDFSECMFFDESKETMISIEIKQDFDMQIYKKRQEMFLKQVTELLMDEKFMELNLKVMKNSIAVDIAYEDAGKHLGAERIEDWMMENGLKPDTIYMIGDNNSDVQMAQELENSYHVIFVFVNDKSELRDTPMCEVVYTKEKFAKGTLEFLENTLA